MKSFTIIAREHSSFLLSVMMTQKLSLCSLHLYCYCCCSTTITASWKLAADFYRAGRRRSNSDLPTCSAKACCCYFVTVAIAVAIISAAGILG